MAAYEGVRVKPKAQWRPQEVRDAREVKHLPRKATGNKWNQSKRLCSYKKKGYWGRAA
jgi:hypothetical protein